MYLKLLLKYLNLKNTSWALDSAILFSNYCTTLSFSCLGCNINAYLKKQQQTNTQQSGNKRGQVSNPLLPANFASSCVFLLKEYNGYKEQGCFESILMFIASKTILLFRISNKSLVVRELWRHGYFSLLNLRKDLKAHIQSPSITHLLLLFYNYYAIKVHKLIFWNLLAHKNCNIRGKRTSTFLNLKTSVVGLFSL